MLLTSGQVSVAISSIIVFICTTVLFLCGYVVQQNTVNDIRRAIKPVQRPVFTDLYVPSRSDGTTAPSAIGEGGDRVQELVVEALIEGEQEEEPPQLPFTAQATEDESEERLIQGSDGGFLRVISTKKNTQAEGSISGNSRRPFVEEAYKEGISNPRILADEAVERDATPESQERLSRAARRKALRDEMKKRVVAEEALLGKNPYRRRRMW